MNTSSENKTKKFYSGIFLIVVAILLSLGIHLMIREGSDELTNIYKDKLWTEEEINVIEKNRKNPDVIFNIGIDIRYGTSHLTKNITAFNIPNTDHIEKDVRKGVRLWRIAAKLGSRYAQRALSYAYQNGEGVIVNEYEAYIWWAIYQATNNDDDYIISPVSISDKWSLSRTEIKEAQKEALHRLNLIDERKKLTTANEETTK